MLGAEAFEEYSRVDSESAMVFLSERQQQLRPLRPSFEG
jgi:hypothetical protein